LNDLEIQRPQVVVHDRKSINKKIVSMIVPITIENLLQMVAGIVSMGMIGRIDALSISALGISMRITQIIWGLFKGITIGATVFVAQYYGAGEMDKVKNVIKQTLLSSIVVVVILQAIVYTQASKLLRVLVWWQLHLSVRHLAQRIKNLHAYISARYSRVLYASLL
jgi:Na+-driven multidrug efflux pump